MCLDIYQVGEEDEELVDSVGASDIDEARAKASAREQQISAGEFHPEPP